MTTRFKSYGCVLLAGLFLPLAFAPISFPGCALFSIALFFYYLQCSEHPARLGFFYGIGVFTLGVSWIYVSIHTYGNTSVLLAVLLTALFILVLACYFSAFAFFLKRFFKEEPLHLQAFAFAALWGIMEWARATLFSGFPWLLLGFSQITTPLKYLAPILGVYGVSFFTALAGCFLSLAFFPNDRVKITSLKRYCMLLIVLLIYTLPQLFSFISWTKPARDPIKVSVIQGNIPLWKKWSEAELPFILNRYARMTEKTWQSDLILWPENAIPIADRDAASYLKQISSRAKKHHTSLIVGLPVIGPHGDAAYNAMIILGQGRGHYFKQHLVPFGETLPLEAFFKKIMDFLKIPIFTTLKGQSNQPLLSVAGISIAPFICYEIAYGSLLWHALPKAELLVTLTDDAWFGHSFAPSQHIQIAQMRSLQSGRPQIIAGNTGISALISYKGEILKRLPQFKKGILQGQITPMRGTTPWILIGDRGCLMLLFLVLLVIGVNKRVKIMLSNGSLA